MDTEKTKTAYIIRAVKSYEKSDKSRKFCAIWCERIVGNVKIFGMGATLGLANDMNVSPDTVEDMAHAYAIFKKLFLYDYGRYSKFVFLSYWRLPYIHYSHFRALYDAQNKYKLSDENVMSILFDIVQGEGSISSRNVDTHAKEKWGENEDWTYEAGQVMKKLNKFLQRPDLPKVIRGRAKLLYNGIGEQVT